MRDLIAELERVQRTVTRRSIPAGAARSVRLHRGYDAAAADVWRACTDPERIGRWFLPVTGDLRAGGTYQLEGNAGGEIMQCEAPRRLAVTWVLGENPPASDIGVVTIEVTPRENGTAGLMLEHAAVVDPGFWSEYGPGAVGVGWELALLGLALFLHGEPVDDPDAFGATPEARTFMLRSSDLWGAAHRAAGASPSEADTAAAATAAFYAPAGDDGPRTG